MLVQIKRKDAFAHYPSFPWAKEYIGKFFYPETHSYYVLAIPPQPNDKKNIAVLAAALAKLIQDLSIDTLVFLGDRTTAWRYQENMYPPVQNALTFLKDQKVSKRFNGAFEVEGVNLSVFFTHLSWLQRCNATLPNIHFIDKQQNIIGEYCRYGNIHLGILNPQIEDSFQDALNESVLMIAENNKCVPLFRDLNGIRGRKTII